jgi:hypothetical protein
MCSLDGGTWRRDRASPSLSLAILTYITKIILCAIRLRLRAFLLFKCGNIGIFFCKYLRDERRKEAAKLRVIVESRKENFSAFFPPPAQLAAGGISSLEL